MANEVQKETQKPNNEVHLEIDGQLHVIRMKRHIGKEGRNKDAQIISFVSKWQKDQGTDIEYFLNHQEEFENVAVLSLDLDDPINESIMDKLTLFDLIFAFQEGVGFRTSSFARNDVQQALKK